MHRIPKSDYVILSLILVLAFYIAFIPHQNYPYLVHIDEWMHLAYTEALLGAGDTAYTDPFFGEVKTGLTGFDLGVSGSHLEMGFYIFWGIFHQISGNCQHPVRPIIAIFPVSFRSVSHPRPNQQHLTYTLYFLSTATRLQGKELPIN